jgi:hypothetical protein
LKSKPPQDGWFRTGDLARLMEGRADDGDRFGSARSLRFKQMAQATVLWKLGDGTATGIEQREAFALDHQRHLGQPPAGVGCNAAQ